jgi:hypothetical protein
MAFPSLQNFCRSKSATKHFFKLKIFFPACYVPCKYENDERRGEVSRKGDPPVRVQSSTVGADEAREQRKQNAGNRSARTGQFAAPPDYEEQQSTQQAVILTQNGFEYRAKKISKS